MTDEDGRQHPSGATMFVPDEDDRQTPGGATMFLPEGDRQPSTAAATLFVPDDEMPPTGRTMVDVLRRWSRRRKFVLAASLALVVTIAALAYSNSRSSTSSDAPAVVAEPIGEQPNRPAAGDEPRIEARPRCTYRGGDAVMMVTCAVRNHGPIWTRVRVTAWLDGGEGVVRRVGAENVLLAPAERVTLHFDGPAPAESSSRCDCRVEALR